MCVLEVNERRIQPDANFSCYFKWALNCSYWSQVLLLEYESLHVVRNTKFRMTLIYRIRQTAHRLSILIHGWIKLHISSWEWQGITCIDFCIGSWTTHLNGQIIWEWGVYTPTTWLLVSLPTSLANCILKNMHRISLAPGFCALSSMMLLTVEHSIFRLFLPICLLCPPPPLTVRVSGRVEGKRSVSVVLGAVMLG